MFFCESLGVRIPAACGPSTCERRPPAASDAGTPGHIPKSARKAIPGLPAFSAYVPSPGIRSDASRGETCGTPGAAAPRQNASSTFLQTIRLKSSRGGAERKQVVHAQTTPWADRLRSLARSPARRPPGNSGCRSGRRYAADFLFRVDSGGQAAWPACGSTSLARIRTL